MFLPTGKLKVFHFVPSLIAIYFYFVDFLIMWFHPLQLSDRQSVAAIIGFIRSSRAISRQNIFAKVIMARQHAGSVATNS